jgi:non-specific serine/threonine protein kinase
VTALDAITPSGGSRSAVAPDANLVTPPGDAGEILDTKARNEYRRRIGEIREELETAEAHNDLGRAESLRTELELLQDELRAAVGPGGRPRRASADVERLRVAITHRIRGAIDLIARHDPALGAHLRASVSTGYRCVYEPAARPSSGERAADPRERKA